MSASQWEIQTGKAYKELLEEEKSFRACELSDLSNEEARVWIDKIEGLEQNVWQAWADSTQDINPSMKADVARAGHKTLTPSTRDYLNKYLAAQL